MNNQLNNVINRVNNKVVRELLFNYAEEQHLAERSMQGKEEKYIIIMLISNLLKEYEKNDFIWENLCELQNENIYNILKTSDFGNNEKFNNRIKYMIRDYEKGKGLPGFLYYKNIILDIFAEVCKGNEIVQFLKAKNRVNRREYNKRTEDEFSAKVLNDYPKESEMKYIITCEYSRKNEDYGEGIININCNGANKFLQKIYKDFFEYYTMEGANNRSLRSFFYCFSDLKEFNNLSDYSKFTFDVLRKGYKILLEIEKREKIHALSGQVVAFYRFLVNKNKTENLGLKLKEFEKYVIMNDSVTKVIKEDFYLTAYNPLENIPKYNKICIVPSEYTMRNSSTDNTKLLFNDFTEVDEPIREVYRDFYWKSNDGNLINRHNAKGRIRDFINFIFREAKYKGDILNLENIYLYRNFVEGTTNPNGLKSKFKAVRKFLKYYTNTCEKFDNINFERILDVMTLKGLEMFSGGEVITENDLKLIYEKFVENEDAILYGRLYTLAFEMFSYSNLRLGEILNLKVDNIYEEFGKSYIKYFPKVGGKELITIPIDEKIKVILSEAKDITKEFRENDIIDNYIFIEKYQRRGGGNKRIRFTQVFKNVIISLTDQLEKKYYKPMNIRHTYMNVVCDQARKRNLSYKEIEQITGDNPKTIKKYYQEMHKIELLVEVMHGVTLSNVSINGNVLKSENQGYFEVKGKLGKCNNKKCIFDIAECLICNNFITFLNRKNEFLKAIERCNEIIEKTTNKLIIEEKYAEKEVLAKYLAEIMKVEEEKKNA